MPQESCRAIGLACACCLLLDRARMQRIVWPRPAARHLAVLGMAGGRLGRTHKRANVPRTLDTLVQPLSTLLLLLVYTLLHDDCD